MPAKILIVEDEQIVAADLESKLTKMGHHVVGIGASAEEALNLARQHCPDLVLMDIQLQGEANGLEAARKIQEICTAQILFVTAYAAVFHKDPNWTKPPGQCLTKPFSAYQLQTSVRVALECKRKEAGPLPLA